VNAHAFCPHCGSDLKVDAPILFDNFSMFGDGYPLLYKQRLVPLTPGQASLVWTLLKAFPHAVKDDTIINRIGSDCGSNVIDVMVSRIRATFRRMGIPNHIETVRGRGFRWSLTEQPYKSQGGGRPKNASAGNRG
jgi:DNA-binding response OmpR family regulator